MYTYSKILGRIVASIWICNCILASAIAIRQVWIPYMNAGSDSYIKIQSDPFDGTTMPIAYIPDWTKAANQDKSKRFEDIAISEYVPTPLYDSLALYDTTSSTKASTLLHYTYTTLYMGSYKLNYREHDGSHLGVDIRAPIGTPILSIANGVVIRTVESDATGNKFIVIRHDNVPLNGTTTTLYSGYLHLSEILLTEGTKVRKGDMIGRVGMTGIATTPHLHLQIDTADAPFHPYWGFTSSESRAAGLGFFESVNAGLGKDNSLKYTIHPMNFINNYLGGVQTESFSSAPSYEKTATPIASNPVIVENNTVIASYIGGSTLDCGKKRYTNVGERSTLGRMLYPLMEKHCIFSDVHGTFDSKGMVTKREAIMTLMQYFGVEPARGTSHFLDVAIGDNFQGYALVAYRQGILDGNYTYSDRFISKAEFIDLLTKIGKVEKNPSQIRIYNDVDAMNPYFQSIQDYAYMARIRGGKFLPNSILTRSSMVQILSGIKEKK